MPNCKSLFRGIFNLTQEVLIERVYAASERQAWLLFCKRIAKRRQVSERQVMQIFNGTRDNFSIQLEMEFTEENE